MALFVKEQYSCSVRQQPGNNSCEMLLVEVKLPGRPLFVSVWYRPPRQPIAAVTNLFIELSHVFDDHNCVMLGDFNARNCAWKHSDVTDSSSRALQLAFVQYGFTVINKDGTRPNMRGGCTPLLGIVAINIPDNHL